jgi:histidine triad domain protein
MKDCIFCKIINNDIPSYKVYEDDLVLSFMTIDPVSNGHILLIPKSHHENVLDMPDDLIVHMHNVIKNKLYNMLKERLNCDGITLSQNNEYGQEIKHYHIHLIPKYKEKQNLLKVEEVWNKLK